MLDGIRLVPQTRTRTLACKQRVQAEASPEQLFEEEFTDHIRDETYRPAPFVPLPRCSPAWSPACSPACSPAHPRTGLPTCLPACLPACLPRRIPSFSMKLSARTREQRSKPRETSKGVTKAQKLHGDATKMGGKKRQREDGENKRDRPSPAQGAVAARCCRRQRSYTGQPGSSSGRPAGRPGGGRCLRRLVGAIQRPETTLIITMLRTTLILTNIIVVLIILTKCMTSYDNSEVPRTGFSRTGFMDVGVCIIHVHSLGDSQKTFSCILVSVMVELCISSIAAHVHTAN